MAASEEDFKTIEAAASTAKDTLIYTFVIPLGFMLFMSVSMNRVWGLYLMLQIVAHITNYEALIIPATAADVANALYYISYFKMMEHPIIK